MSISITDITDPIVLAKHQKALELRDALAKLPPSPVIRETRLNTEIRDGQEVPVPPVASIPFIDICQDLGKKFYSNIAKPAFNWLFGYVDYSEGFVEIDPDVNLASIQEHLTIVKVPVTLGQNERKPTSAGIFLRYTVDPETAPQTANEEVTQTSKAPVLRNFNWT